MTAATLQSQETTRLPDMKVSVRQVFGIDTDLEVPAYSEVDPHVPDVDPDYRFDRATTLAILAGFAKNRRVMVTGFHGTATSPRQSFMRDFSRSSACPWIWQTRDSLMPRVAPISRRFISSS